MWYNNAKHQHWDCFKTRIDTCLSLTRVKFAKRATGYSCDHLYVVNRCQVIWVNPILTGTIPAPPSVTFSPLPPYGPRPIVVRHLELFSDHCSQPDMCVHVYCGQVTTNIRHLGRTLTLCRWELKCQHTFVRQHIYLTQAGYSRSHPFRDDVVSIFYGENTLFWFLELC